MTQVIRSLLILALLAAAGRPAFAQQPKAGSSKTDSKTTKVLGSQLTTILEFGLAGGALGLSTLSFYGRPQDKLSHIPVGMALGIFVGAIYSTSTVVHDPSHLSTQFEFEPLVPPADSPLAFQWAIDF